MTENLQPISHASSVHARRLRSIGLLVFIIDLLAAGIVGYANVKYPPVTEDNSLLDGYYKHQSAEMQRLWGNLGPTMLSLREEFQHIWPAIIIAALSILTAFVCFFAASRLDRSKSDGSSG